MSGDVHARFWESPGVRFPRATQHREVVECQQDLVVLLEAVGSFGKLRTVLFDEEIECFFSVPAVSAFTPY